MLLVDDGQGQVPELNRIFNQGVRPHQHLHRAVAQAGVDRFAFFGLRVAGQQLDAGAGRGQELLHALVVLVGQHFGRRHDAGLVAIVKRHHGRQYCHERLSAAHVALQQAVHLLAAGHVGPDLLEHALLGTGQRKRQRFVGLVEIVPDAAEDHTAVSPHADAFLAQKRKLEVEQFLEFQASLCPLQILDRSRKMDVLQGEGERGQVLFFADPGRHGLFERAEYLVEQRADDLLEEFIGDAGVVEFLRTGIDPHHHAQLCKTFFRGQIDFRVDQVPALSEDGRLAENHVLRSDLQFVFHPLESLEEDQVDGARSVAEARDQSLGTRLAHFLDAGDAPAQLDVGRRRIDLPDAVKAGAVDIAEREIVKQVAERADAQLFVQKLSPLRPHARQILDITVQHLRHTQIYGFFVSCGKFRSS